jgi:hypothetical protein
MVSIKDIARESGRALAQGLSPSALLKSTSSMQRLTRCFIPSPPVERTALALCRLLRSPDESEETRKRLPMSMHALSKR